MRRFQRLAIALAIALSGSAYAELIDAVVATVDKEVILYSDLLVAIGEELDNLQRSVSSQQEYNRRADQLLRDALEQAIENRLLLREARKYPEIADTVENRLEEVMEQARERFDTQEEFVEAVRGVAGSVSEFREQQRRQLLAQGMSATRLASFENQVVVSDEEIAQYYQDHKDEFERPERIFIRQIFLRVPEDDQAAREQARAKLELLHEEIEAGADFADLAKLHSEALGAEQGGVMGWQQRGDLILPLEEAAFALPEGGVSDVIETRGGLHLLKVDEREEAGRAPLEDVRLEIEPILREKAAQERFETWLNDLRKRSRVRVFL